MYYELLRRYPEFKEDVRPPRLNLMILDLFRSSHPEEHLLDLIMRTIQPPISLHHLHRAPPTREHLAECPLTGLSTVDMEEACQVDAPPWIEDGQVKSYTEDG